ncbi:MAG: FtsX-like permease family protein [Planctomycetes bacterium]|nr:FtsX-like permease family protein [Planctomycetota bacterium]
MNWVAWKMLTGDRAKYLGTVFGVAFGVLLISQQMAIFVGLMRRTAHAAIDVRDASIWVMDPEGKNADEVKPLSDSDLYRVRGVEGVDWAVRLYKSLARARIDNGEFRQSILLGIDDHTLVGAPVRLVAGSLADLRRPDAIIIDQPGYRLFWGTGPIELGKTLEMNDHRAVVVGVCDTTPPFQTFPVIYTRYSQALGFAPRERNQLSFVLAHQKDGLDPQQVCQSIRSETGLAARTRPDMIWFVIKFYLESTGIPVNFGITIALGFIVGTAIAGQTFYLFTLENLKQFGALKAMGVSNWRLVGMILLQATIVGCIGYGLGIGMTAVFFESTQNVTALMGFYLPWQVAGLAAGAVALIIVLASLISLRKVLILEPAVVFRG